MVAVVVVIDLHDPGHDLAAADTLHDLDGIAVIGPPGLPCGLNRQLPLAMGTRNFAVVRRAGQRGLLPAGRADPGHGTPHRRVPAT